jgi:transcriptional regulator with XRE-family HTH domain
MASAIPAIGAEIFGQALRHLRNQAGLSLRELGKRALYDFTRLSRAERGEIILPPGHVRVLDKILRADGLLIALREAAALEYFDAARPDDTVNSHEQVLCYVQLPGGAVVHMSMPRRQFAQLVASGALTAVLPGYVNREDASRLADSLARPARIDDHVIGCFRDALGEYYAADKMIGSRTLISAVLAQIQVLDQLRRGARQLYADRLLEILAQYGEMAGWLLQDSGDIPRAADWSRRAAEWAQCAGDARMAAYMLIRQANIAGQSGDHRAVVQLAAAARRPSGYSEPRLTALALQQEARGHAALGQTRTCLGLLGRATEIMTTQPDVAPGAPIYLRHYDLLALQEQGAACYRATGQADRAVAVLTTAIAGLPADAERDRGHLTAKLAVAVASTHPPDYARAASLGSTALAVAQVTGSARIVRELHSLRALLANADNDETRAFTENIGEVPL